MEGKFVIVLPQSVETKFKPENRYRPAFQINAEYDGGRQGVGDKRGRERYNMNPQDKGRVVHNKNPNRSIADNFTNMRH